MQRTIGAPLLAALGVIALQWPSIGSAQQAYPSFHDVDFFYAQQPQVFQALWQAAQTQTIRIAVLGDSQETSPGSHGFQYIPLLNYEMWKRFGNSPETPVAGCFYHGNSGPANWLLAGQCAAPGPTATRLDATQILPNAQPSAFSTLNGATNITGGNRGQLTMLRPDASGVDPSTQIPTEGSYFNTSGVVAARIYAATNVTSGELGYQARPNATSSVSYSAAVTTRGTLALGLQSPTFSIKSGETPALEFNRHPYLQLEVFGSSDSALTDVIGLRFINKTHPQGVVIDNFSLGGYTAARFLSIHANAGQMFSAFGFHAAILHYGANEGGSSSAAQFKSDISAVIARVRTWMGDANFPIVLIADVYESALPTARRAEYDRYVGAQLAIAQTDPNVMVINARRLMENIGWKATGGRSSEFLEDGVHYTGLGARSLSAAEVAAMMGEIHASGCPSDPGSVTLRASMTLVVDVGGTTACANHGQLAVAQALTLHQATLKVVLTDGFTPAIGDRFKVLSFNSLAGTFGTLTLPTLSSGLSWNTDELYTAGTISVAEASPPPEPPVPPPAPTLSVTSGASQSITLPGAPAPVAFTLNGSGTLSVTASSDNATLLPDAGISISAGCGLETLACTMTLVPATGQTGSAAVSLTVADTHSQSATTTVMVEVKAAPPAEPGSGTANGGQTGTASNGHSGGGGGSMDLLCLLAGLLWLAIRQYTSGTSMSGGTACRE